LNKNKDSIVFILLGLLALLLFVSNMYIGDVRIGFGKVVELLLGGTAENDSWSYIVESRLNRSIVAIFGGGALAVAGLIMQVFFRNQLAGPGVLGITSGASLGVAAVIMGGFSIETFFGSASLILSGVIGAFSVLLILLFLSKFIKNQVTLLVVGLMIGYFISAIVNILFLWANQSDTREYVIWGLGSFEGLSTSQMLLFVGTIGLTIFLCVFIVKALNALVLGSEYAASLGINLTRTRVIIILVTSILAAVVTVYCGPISFIGIAVPQIIRLIVRSKNHLLIIPICFIGGGVLGLFADIIVRASSNSLPLNTVTALIGAPIIIWTIVKLNKRFAQI